MKEESFSSLDLGLVSVRDFVRVFPFYFAWDAKDIITESGASLLKSAHWQHRAPGCRITHSVSKRIFMMSGHERRLMWLGLGEAGMNLALSLMLVLLFQKVVSFAVESLVPSVFFGWCLLWPWVARDVSLHLLLTGGLESGCVQLKAPAQAVSS